MLEYMTAPLDNLTYIFSNMVLVFAILIGFALGCKGRSE